MTTHHKLDAVLAQSKMKTVNCGPLIRCRVAVVPERVFQGQKKKHFVPMEWTNVSSAKKFFFFFFNHVT